MLCPARGSPALQPRGSPTVSPGIASLSRSLPAPSPAPAKAQCSDLRTMHLRSRPAPAAEFSLCILASKRKKKKWYHRQFCTLERKENLTVSSLRCRAPGRLRVNECQEAAVGRRWPRGAKKCSGKVAGPDVAHAILLDPTAPPREGLSKLCELPFQRGKLRLREDRDCTATWITRHRGPAA